MADAAAITRLQATLIGPVAARALRNRACGTVRAVFDRSLYICLDPPEPPAADPGSPRPRRGRLAGMTGNEEEPAPPVIPEAEPQARLSGITPSHPQWICIGPASLGAGPLNLLIEPWPGGDSLNSFIPAGASVHAANGTLRFGNACAVRFSGAREWHPAPPPNWNRTSLARGLTALAYALPPNLPAEGLARLLRSDQSDPPTPVLAAAMPPARYLVQLVESPTADTSGALNAPKILPLIGLGPGLTPAGDDFLGGVLIALAITGHIALRDRLRRAIAPHLAIGTSDISGAHLVAAAEGYGSAAVHDLLNAILSGTAETLPTALAAVAAIGHTSGWDALAGAVTALRTLSRRAHPGGDPVEARRAVRGSSFDEAQDAVECAASVPSNAEQR